jgi:hypothetical protein
MPREELQFVADGIEFMKLCVDVTLYWRGSAYDHTAGILHFYREALSLLRPRLKYYEREDMEGAMPIAHDTLDMLPNWLAGADPTKDIFALDLETNSVPNMPSDMALSFWAVEYPDEPAGMIRIVLPTAVAEESPSALINQALLLARDLRFHSGQAGYTLNWDFQGDYAVDARKQMSVLSRRFPAIDVPEAPATLMAIPTGMKRINWVTFVGNSLMEEKGFDASDLQPLDTRPLPHGIAVVAGDKPRLGDVNRQEDLSAYHEVGRALATLRSPDHPPLIPDSQGDPQDDRTEEWLSYFDN